MQHLVRRGYLVHRGYLAHREGHLAHSIQVPYAQRIEDRGLRASPEVPNNVQLCNAAWEGLVAHDTDTSEASTTGARCT
jgi:hypothetical protein